LGLNLTQTEAVTLLSDRLASREKYEAWVRSRRRRSSPAPLAATGLGQPPQVSKTTQPSNLLQPNSGGVLEPPERSSSSATLAPTTATPQAKNLPANLGLGFGIASAFLWELWVPGMVAIILSVVGLNRAKVLARASGPTQGRRFAIAGLTLGIVYTTLPVLRIVVGQ